MSRWAEAEGTKVTERKQRCAKLTGDVAARAVELLNAWHAGQFVPAYVPAESVGECMTCHGPDGLADTHGKMDCVAVPRAALVPMAFICKVRTPGPEVPGVSHH